MTLLPSPIPHPLDFSPWELPGWVHEALDWVVGVEWPEGNERAVWDLADQWYGVAEALGGPHADAVAAAGEVRAGYGGVGAVAAAFDAAWRRVTEGDEAPLPVLLAVSGDLGRLVEECGCDIEGAKLEVWIELGILVVELLALAVAAVLTAGAASPAAGAAITASRFVVQQIFKKLMAQLARKSLKQGLKEAGERAAKQVAEGGARGLARKAARGGLAEAAEEGGVTLATQTYQNSTGRRHGLDLADAGMSALGGLAGGAVAPLAGLGRHASGRGARIGEHFGREMTGEVLADQAARLSTGQGPMSLEDAARAAASGATGSATAQTDAALRQRLDSRMAALGGTSFAPPDLSAPPGAAAPPGAVAPPGPVAPPEVEGSSGPGRAVPTPGAGAEVGEASHDAGPVGSRPAGEPSQLPPDGAAGPASPTPVPTPPTTEVQAAGVVSPADQPTEPVPVRAVDPAADSRSSPPQPGPGVSEASAREAQPTLSSTATPEVLPAGLRSADAGSVPVAGTVGSPAADSHLGAGPGVSSDARPASFSTTATSANTAVATPLPSPQQHGGDPVGATRQGEYRSLGPAVVSPGAPKPNPPASPPPPTPPAPRGPSGGPPPRSPEWYAAQWAADREAFDRRHYQDYFLRQRSWYEDNRRRDRAAVLRASAEHHYEQARWLMEQAHDLYNAGRREAADRFVSESGVKERQHHRQTELAEEVLKGTVAPSVVEVRGGDNFERLNTDVPSLIVDVAQVSGPSALTGDDDPPSIDRSRAYGQWGGLRPPLALHQSDLEGAMPRDADGRVQRCADPRQGGWFKLANDGGPRADPTRGINCLDCTLSLYETWMHGRPRVSAPRTFDAYALGDINRPLGGEIDGPGRVEDVTGGRFQKLADGAEDLPPHEAWKAVHQGFRSLEDQVRAGGHGTYAFLITSYEGGGSHAWAAVNQNGSVVYLDPQNGWVSDMPLYVHGGRPAPHNVTAIDALVVGPDGRPLPLAGAGPGNFSQRGPVVDERPPPEPEPQEDSSRERQPGPEEPFEDRSLNRIHLLGEPGPVDPGLPGIGGSGPEKGFPGSAPEDEETAAGRLRRERLAARAYLELNGSAPKDVIATAVDLDQVFAAGVTPVEIAAELDGPTLRRLAPSLDEAAARDVANLFRHDRVRQMLDLSWRNPPDGEPMIAETLVKQLAELPSLARIILTTPELAKSLTVRPITLHHLASHHRAISILETVVQEIADIVPTQDAVSVAPTPKPTPLTPRQVEVSASVVVDKSRKVKQSGFDDKRRADAVYRSAYLDILYQSAAVAQGELVALAKELAQVGGRESGRAGWRDKPKVRKRAEDKVKKYDGDVGRLLDLAAAKVEFDSLDDLYEALDRLRDYPRVRVVRFEDRFQNPEASGYRDVQLVLSMSNGHLAEFRLHLAALDEVAVWEHALYEVKRDIEAIAREEGRELTVRERAIVARILQYQQQFFWDALKSAIQE
ncbi:toxin glutamine deamidase domain-containing protein [Micromonospora sp. DT233]|uniref:toxin glutamine deamidase domain-containing protein n=1 Tax=Micromonospora sp. DT233 TaxID=3393432 RepID=UPI003CF41BFA